MPKTIIICGYGPGISNAVAEKFGAEGFQLALVGRTADKLAAGVSALGAKGIKAEAFTADLSNPVSVRDVIKKVRSALGPITVVEWTAYSAGAGDLITADAAAIRAVLDVPVTCLLAAVQEALPDLRREKDAAVLVANGGLGYFDPKADAAAVQVNAMGLSLANAAKHKLVGLLAVKLKPENVYVGEVMVLGSVTKPGSESGRATVEPAAVANKFWDLYQARAEVSGEVR
jgi:NAD(P)-dependent dehydrogenase (short-subunit alcohol dehydrogenase family)